jgi:hypothetical protein
VYVRSHEAPPRPRGPARQPSAVQAQANQFRSFAAATGTAKSQTLRPHHHNARTHSKRQIEQIAQSIERFGFLNPVLIDASGAIIAGHGRVEAAKLLGLSRVPTLRIEHLSDAEKRAYILADNKLAEKAGWDREILAVELQALVDMDFEIERTGFEMAEVDFILDEATEIKQAPLLPEDAVPELSAESPVAKRGDLWLLGAHRLYCGDARDERAYDALMKGTKADCPPSALIGQNGRI